MQVQITEFAREQHEKMFPGAGYTILHTDPEFIERFDNFAFDEVIHATPELPEETRFLAILALLIGCQGIDEFRMMLPAAMRMGVSPVAAREAVYQAVAYLGIGRVYPFIRAMNEVFQERGIALPLPSQAQTSVETRREAGTAAQVAIFGERMQDFWQQGTVNRMLAANCFGDYYTRTGLTLAERELITFCFLAAQGGCEPQLVSHAEGNLRMGNDAAFLRAVVIAGIPFIGYPRSLNAMRCVAEAEANFKKQEEEAKK